MDLKTRDPNAAAAFFERALGWTVETDQGSWRRATVIRVGEHRIGGLSDVTAAIYPPSTPPHIACYLAVDEVDAKVAAAVEAGARLLVAPFDAGDEGRIATLIDPFGAAVSLWQRRAPWRGWTHPRATRAAPRRLQHLSADPSAAAEFYQYILGMTDPDTDFTGLAKPNTVPGWHLIVAVDSVTEVQRQAGESHGGTGLDPADDRGAVADLTAPDGLTFSIGGLAPGTGFAADRG